MLEKLQRVKLSEEILFRLKEMIKTGQFGYGDKLPVEKRMAEIFGVSRTTVREALAVLEAEGWVSTKRGGGTFVKRIRAQEPVEPLTVLLGNSEAGVLELMEMRRIFEGEVALLAASRATTADLEAMRKALRDMTNDVAQNKETAESDYAFHYCIAKAAKNNVIMSVMGSLNELYQQVVQTSRWHSAKPEDYERIIAEHEAITRAIEKRQGTKAKKLMNIHLESAYRTIEEVLLKNDHRPLSGGDDPK